MVEWLVRFPHKKENLGSNPSITTTRFSGKVENKGIIMHLIPIVKEVQFNLVDDIENINSRRAVYRIRINGNIGWLDMLQGKSFFRFLRENRAKFIKSLKEYNLDYIEANLSDEMLVGLKSCNFNIITVYKVKLVGVNTNHVKFAVI